MSSLGNVPPTNPPRVKPEFSLSSVIALKGKADECIMEIKKILKSEKKNH